MADEHNILPTHKPRQKKIAGRKIGMPPLDYHQIRLLPSDITRRPHDVERIRCVKQILCALYFEAVIAVIPLFLMKKEFGVLHFIGDHLHIVPFCQLSTHESRIVGNTAFVRVYRPDEDDLLIFSHTVSCHFHFSIYSENIILYIDCKYLYTKSCLFASASLSSFPATAYVPFMLQYGKPIN